MFFQVNIRRIVSVVIVQFIVIIILAQPGVPVTKWSSDGNVLYQVEKGEIVKN